VKSWGALLLCLAGACGYRAGLPLATGYESLGIEIFGNDSPERDLERELHVALTRAARDRVAAPLVAPGEAGLVMRGKLLEYRYRPGIRSKENVQLETGLTIRAEAYLWDPGREERVAGPVRADVQVGYALDEPGANARGRARALTNLSERLVLQLLTSVEPATHPPTDLRR